MSQQGLLENNTIHAGAYQGMHALDTTRYTLPIPTDTTDEQAWRKIIHNDIAQLMHQHYR